VPDTHDLVLTTNVWWLLTPPRRQEERVLDGVVKVGETASTAEGSAIGERQEENGNQASS